MYSLTKTCVLPEVTTDVLCSDCPEGISDNTLYPETSDNSDWLK